MNSVAFTPKTSTSRTGNPWDGEVKNLYKNFYLIELILCQPNGLSSQAVARYQKLQQLLLETVEQFLTELDSFDQKKAIGLTSSCEMLRKHALVMKELNASVDALIMELQMGQCA